MKKLIKYFIILYPIMFLIGFSLAVYLITIIPLAVTMVLMLILSKLQQQQQQENEF